MDVWMDISGPFSIALVSLNFKGNQEIDIGKDKINLQFSLIGERRYGHLIISRNHEAKARAGWAHSLHGC